jgi:choline-sulfatase
MTVSERSNAKAAKDTKDRFFSLLLCASAASLLAALAWPAIAQTSAPSILLITLDTVRADHIGAYGYTKGATPTLDRLAREGVRFADATTQAPLTGPAHAAILTGQYPARFGVRDNASTPVPSNIPTLAETLKAKGYRTGGFVGAFILGPEYGFGRGFDTFDATFAHFSAGAKLQAQRRGGEVVDAALAWLKSTGPQPFFAWVHLYDAHTPYEPPEPFRSRFAATPYDGEIAYADSCVARLVDAIAQRGLADRTAIAVLADHGEGLGDHGEAEHGLFLYESVLHVPWILRLPARESAGVVVNRQVRTIDVAPTLAAIAGSAMPRTDGENVLPLVRSASRGPERAALQTPEPAARGPERAALQTPERAARGPERAALQTPERAAPRTPERAAPQTNDPPPSYAETYYPRWHFGWSELKSVRVGDWKYIDAPKPELYDMRADAGERHNALDARGALANGLSAALNKIQSGFSAATAEAPQPDAETLARLRSLGYVGIASPSPGVRGADPKEMVPKLEQFRTGINRAIAALERNAPDLAIAELKKLVAINERSYELHLFLGDAYAAKREFATALGEYDAAAVLNTHSSAPFVSRARVHLAMGDLARAQQQIDAAAKLEPASSEAAVVRGEIFEKQGRTADALAQYDAAVRANGSDAQARASLASLAMRTKQYDAARPQLEKLLEMGYRPSRMQFGLAQIAEAQGDTKRAIASYREALRLEPGLPEAKAALSRLGVQQ